MRKYFISLLLIVVNKFVFPQTDADHAFDIYASVDIATPSVTLNWVNPSATSGVSISKKEKSEKNFVPLVSLPAKTNTYTDYAVSVGKAYEYLVVSGTAKEYIAVGLMLPLVDYRGKIILVVEKQIAEKLSDKIERLMMDIRGDGWQVKKIEVESTTKAPEIRQLIRDEYDKDKINTKAVFIFGQVAQPLSGCTAPDGHSDHNGAWATEMYYADIDGIWTDTKATCTDCRNPNVPADGKFDQYSLPTDAELQVGRVDFTGLVSFGNDLSVSYNNYLDKNHLFRIKKFTAPRKALIMDKFNAGYASSAFSYFNAAFGKNNTIIANDPGPFKTGKYLWGYAANGGSPDGFSGWHSADFSINTYYQVFFMLFGSYFGDYQLPDNFMKAALASKGWILTCSWSGRPEWHYYHMAIGENIGYSALINMNNNGTYTGGYYRNIQINLLGDPTLRQDMIAPPLALKSTVVNNHVKLQWSPSLDSVEGYHIYKAQALDSVFVRVTSVGIKDTSWTDPVAVSGNYYYQVKAYRLEQTRCGSYYNTSRGVFATNDSNVKDYPLIIGKPVLTHLIEDQKGLIFNNFSFQIPDDFVSNVDPDAVHTFQVYKAGTTSLPSGWMFDPKTRILSTTVMPLVPIRFDVVVKVTDQDNNFVLDTFEVNIIDPNAVPVSFADKNHEADLCIFPNPAKEKIIIKPAAGKIINSFIIFDTSGIERYAVNHIENEIIIDVSGWTKGVYIIRVTEEEKTRFKMLMIL